MQTGWVKIGSYWYYFDSNGAMHYGWLHIGDETYYCLNSGRMARGRVKNSKGQTYFFNYNNKVKNRNAKEGELQKGWTQVGANWYHMDENSGVITYGLYKEDGETYFFNESTGIMKRGWQTIDGEKYYFKTDGKMAVGETISIGGVQYTFDEDGHSTSQSWWVDGENVKVKDTNGRIYTLEKEFATHKGVADGSLSDRDLFAMLVDAEANDQGQAGMTAVAVTILNRTISADTWFPDTFRYVVYQRLQYAPVRDGALQRRLNGIWEEKTMAYKAVDTAYDIIEDYLNTGKARRISGISTSVMGRSDFDCLYFMTPAAFENQEDLEWEACRAFQYKGHVFFSVWP